MTRLLVAALALACAAAVQAAPFNDPTRPPTVTDAATPGGGSPDEPRLESVLIAPDRRVAVINGQQVVVGARIAGGEVVRISETEVVIRGNDRSQTLKLLPEARRPAEKKKGTTP